jgi:probable rRNA maturation factor
LRLTNSECVICFVTDAEIARMNEAFRKKRGPTDVLSFPAQKQYRARRGNLASSVALKRRPAKPEQRAESSDRKYLGDIAISPATARRNAAKYGRTLNAELRILMLHGVLHLLGYDHETDRGEMSRIEVKLRRRFGLA